ncbi:MAG: pyridoxamine 5'-phosphate oxidase [Synechococcales cyanobacterium RM1_1_8]|nr:pyridoxamine 5'-phosphate oxidase [Synechococcales cyanobacterium RM1_1_8]
MTELAPWRSPLARALHRNRALAYARYGQLATVRPNGCPANRTVVFRGFLDQAGLENGLKFVCDRRSHKVPELQANPWAEFCWYFPKTREQFRLGGAIAVVTAAGAEAPGGNPEAPSSHNGLATARDQTWQALSAGAKASFYWPQPGAPRAEAAAFTGLQVDESAPPEAFVLLVLQPQTVDHLELRGEPQTRQRYRLMQPDPAQPDLTSDPKEQWQQESINP